MTAQIIWGIAFTKGNAEQNLPDNSSQSIWQQIVAQLDAYNQLNGSGELLYVSPPCDVEH